MVMGLCTFPASGLLLSGHCHRTQCSGALCRSPHNTVGCSMNIYLLLAHHTVMYLSRALGDGTRTWLLWSLQPPYQFLHHSCTRTIHRSLHHWIILSTLTISCSSAITALSLPYRAPFGICTVSPLHLTFIVPAPNPATKQFWLQNSTLSLLGFS